MAANLRILFRIPTTQVCRNQNLIQKRSMSQNPKIKELQERFQMDDGTPVYKKGGLFDKVLMGANVVLIAICMADAVMFMANRAFGKSSS